MGKLDDLEKIQELKNKGILTQEEFETEKQKILNHNNNIQNTATIDKIEESTEDKAVSSKKKIILISIPIFIVILLLVVFFIIHSQKASSENDNNTNQIENTSQEDSQTSEELLAIEFGKKYKSKEAENNSISSYIIFENNHFEIGYKESNQTIYMQGDYLQYMNQLKFKISKLGYDLGSSITGGVTLDNVFSEEGIKEEQIGILSDGGKTITIKDENSESLVIYELSEESATMQVIPEEVLEEQQIQEIIKNQTNTSPLLTKSPSTSTTTNSTPQKEMVEVPWFSYLGESLEYYTNKLQAAGIPYRVEKKQDLNYSTGTVRNIEHNGEKIEKGTTITITVIDNSNYVYDMEVWVNTGYLLNLVGLPYTYEEKDRVNLSIKINNVEVCNGEFKRESYSTSPIQVGNYRGQKDNLKFDITIEGKKVTQAVHYIFKDKLYGDKPVIVIYKGGDMGPLG